MPIDERTREIKIWSSDESEETDYRRGTGIDSSSSSSSSIIVLSSYLNEQEIVYRLDFVRSFFLSDLADDVWSATIAFATFNFVIGSLEREMGPEI